MKQSRTGAAMSDRCTRSNANAAWTCVLPEGHEGDHIYTLWSEIAIHAEAAAQRVRDVCDLWQRRHDSSIRHPADIPAVSIVAVLRALDGDGDA